MTIFVGSFQNNDVFHRTLTIIACSSIVITAVYILRLVGKILYQEYDSHLDTLQERNSYSKTDKDATFMRMKEDAMRNGQGFQAYAY